MHQYQYYTGLLVQYYWWISNTVPEDQYNTGTGAFLIVTIQLSYAGR